MTTKNNIKTNNSNASASAFGWDFQRNAAIFLMLKNIKLAKTVRVEGEIEDIEIELSNGGIIYSQAKSISTANATSHILDNLKKALETLNNASKQSHVQELIYITNHSNPLSDMGTVYLFSNGYSKYAFSELTEKCQNKINKIINKNNYCINTDKLYFCVLPFLGNDKDTKYKHIKEEVGKFLHSCNIYDYAAPERILCLWQNDFFDNATKNNFKIKIEKEKMIWTIIVDLCSFEKIKNDEILENCTQSMIRDIEKKYHVIINNNSEDFLFLNKVLADYNEFEKKLCEKERMKKFINENYLSYENYFEIDNIDENIKNCLIKLVIKKIIDIKNITEYVKKGANL